MGDSLSYLDNLLVNVNAVVNFAQIVKKATCLMTIAQYNANNNLSPEFE